MKVMIRRMPKTTDENMIRNETAKWGKNMFFSGSSSERTSMGIINAKSISKATGVKS